MKDRLGLNELRQLNWIVTGDEGMKGDDQRVCYGMVWYGTVWRGVVWYGVVWCGLV